MQQQNLVVINRSGLAKRQRPGSIPNHRQLFIVIATYPHPAWIILDEKSN